MLLKDFTVVKIMLTAIVTGMIGVHRSGPWPVVVGAGVCIGVILLAVEYAGV